MVPSLPLTGCVTLGSHGTSVSSTEDNEVGRKEKVPPPAARPGQSGMGQLRSEIQSLWGVAGQCDRRDRQEQGQGQAGWLCSFQNNGRKGGGGEKLRVTGLGTLAGGRRVLVPGSGSSHFPCRAAFFPAWLWGWKGRS